MNCPSASSESLPTSTAPPASHGQLDDLLDRCRSLLGEISAFQEYLRELGRENSVELRAFRNSVGSELKAIKRVFLDRADRSSQHNATNNVHSSQTRTRALRTRSMPCVQPTCRFWPRSGLLRNRARGCKPLASASTGTGRHPLSQEAVIRVAKPRREVLWWI